MKIPRKYIKSSEEQVIACPAMTDCLAKTWQQANGSALAGRNVFTHCLIVGMVARSLLKRLPAWMVSRHFPKGSALTAALHDIGKISPTFQRKVYKNFSTIYPEVWELIEQADRFKIEENKSWGGHAGVSQSTAYYLQSGQFIPEILGQHHGFSPNLGGRQAIAEDFGGKPWLELRIKLVEELKSAFKEDFPSVKDSNQAKLLAGLTTVSDWVGSGSLFDDPKEDWEDKIEQALDYAGFISPSIQKSLSFEQVFGFHPHEAQEKLIEIADKPGVFILEAPMGLGKTEAALYAAYKLLEQGRATGIYFALPTQLTSEKIHERVQTFLQTILTPESLHAYPTLLHGQAWLKQVETEMGVEANPGGAWFNQGKRGILSPFAVGTIDQALMAVLNVKHGFVRTFGLAGKVVILDEVHTYDAYTGTIMDELIDALRKVDCTVIILSATLTQKRRSKLIKAQVYSADYPLITGVDSDSKLLKEVPVSSNTTQTVTVHIEGSSDRAFEKALLKAEQGQQVLWIENTVAEAQEMYLRFNARSQGLGVQAGLVHSRFTQIHRQQNEDKWVTAFGKEGWKDRNLLGRILIGTQVLEQSLDIDADFLVSKLAPTDMLLQRFGRLWRHKNPNRNLTAKQEAWIITPQLELAIKDPVKHLGNSAKVYAPYVLCRTLEVWQSLEKITLPTDIRSLIEATYQNRHEDGAMAKHLFEVERQREKLHSFALMGLSTVGQVRPDEQVKTRYSEQETVEVLPLKSIQFDYIEDSFLGTKVTLLDGNTYFMPHNGRALGHNSWRKLAAIISQNTVKVADYTAPNSILKARLSWLKDYIYLGSPEAEFSNVRVAIVQDDEQLGVVFGNSQISDKYNLTYNDHIGYKAEKI